jgi:hypothetical protein
VPQWFLVGVLALGAVFVLTRVVSSRNEWFAGRSLEFTSLAPHLNLLFELGRNVDKGDREQALFAEHFEFLSELFLSSALAHTGSRLLLERNMRWTVDKMYEDGFDVYKLFKEKKCERSLLFAKTLPTYKQT